jgi:hypothetical protein
MKRILIGLAVVAVVVAAGVGAAFITGVVPGAGGNSDAGGETDETYQKTVVVQGTDSGSSSSGDKASGGSNDADSGSGDADSTEQSPFSFRIKNIEECGQTCREVTASVTNNQNVTAEDVTVRSVIYTDGEKIWEGKSSLGDVGSGETATDTKTVKLGYMEAYKVKQNDGKILVKTYVITAEGTYVYKDTRDVA